MTQNLRSMMHGAMLRHQNLKRGPQTLRGSAPEIKQSTGSATNEVELLLCPSEFATLVNNYILAADTQGLGSLARNSKILATDLGTTEECVLENNPTPEGTAKAYMCFVSALLSKPSTVVNPDEVSKGMPVKIATKLPKQTADKIIELYTYLVPQPEGQEPEGQEPEGQSAFGTTFDEQEVEVIDTVEVSTGTPSAGTNSTDLAKLQEEGQKILDSAKGTVEKAKTDIVQYAKDNKWLLIAIAVALVYIATRKKKSN
jgi:hypothetical protein